MNYKLFSLLFMGFIFSIQTNAFRITIKNNTGLTVAVNPGGLILGKPTGPMMDGKIGKNIFTGKQQDFAVINGAGTKTVYVNHAGRLDMKLDSDRNKIKVPNGGSLDLNFNDVDKLVCFDPKNFKVYHIGKDGKWNVDNALLYKVETGSEEARKLSESLAIVSEAITDTTGALPDILSAKVKAALDAVAGLLPKAAELLDDPSCFDQNLTLINLDAFSGAGIGASLVGKFALLKF